MSLACGTVGEGTVDLFIRVYWFLAEFLILTFKINLIGKKIKYELILS